MSCSVSRPHAVNVNVKRSRRAIAGAISALLLVLAAGQAEAARSYRIQAIPAGDDVQPESASSINQTGDVVGTARLAIGKARGGFVFRGGLTTQVGLRDDRALQLNASGDVAGQVLGQAAWWEADGQEHRLASQMSCVGTSTVAGISDERLVAGWIACNDGSTHAFVHQNGVTTDLPTLGGHGADARAVNAVGQVVGVAAASGQGRAGTVFRGYRWDAGQMLDLGTLGGDGSDAWAISSNGHVVGTAQDATGRWQPYLHDGTRMTPLPLCRGEFALPRGINASDEIIGIAGDGRKKKPFLMRNGRCHWLTDLLDDSGAGWERLSLSAINDAGQLAGSGIYHGEPRAFVATPVAP